MSALEQLPRDSSNRRATERRMTGSIAVVFGRGEGVLVDLSRRGARIRHFAPAWRGAAIRVSFEWEHTRFSATAEVLASRVISLGEGPSYESRIRFTFIDEESQGLLAAVLDEILVRNERRWVANLRGWSDGPQPEPTPFPTNSFIRCHLDDNRWKIKRTRDKVQPANGFLLPSESTDADIQTLCDNYSRGNEHDRQLIRVMAAAVVEQSREKR